MKTVTSIFMIMTSLAIAEPLYLEVEGKTDARIAEPVFVRLEVVDKADAEAKLIDVVAEYFADIEYSAVYHQHFHGPDVRKPCEATPLRKENLTKYVEVYTEVDQYHLPEMVRVGCIDESDADSKAKDIKKNKWFKDKTTKVKVKL